MINNINQLNRSKYVHASNLITKSSNEDSLQLLKPIIEHYLNYINSILKMEKNNNLSSEELISHKVLKLNEYLDFIDNSQHGFTSQSKFRPTIIEEFMYILFNKLIEEYCENKSENFKSNLIIGRTEAYTNLYFIGNNFDDFIETPKIKVNNKNQDFSIFRPFKIKCDNNDTLNINLPILSIENKTSLDKTMLEGAIATASKIKNGNPYSKFYIITEFYDVDLAIDPVYSDIDQIYVIRKQKSPRSGQIRNSIDYQIFVSMYNDVKEYLNRDWSNIRYKLENEGKII